MMNLTEVTQLVSSQELSFCQCEFNIATQSYETTNEDFRHQKAFLSLKGWYFSGEYRTGWDNENKMF